MKQTTSTHKKTILPHILPSTKPKNKLERDKAAIEQIFKTNSSNLKYIKDYRQSQQFISLKANNFLSRIDTIDNPDIIFNISDHLKQVANKEQLSSSSIFKENINNQSTERTNSMTKFLRNNKDIKSLIHSTHNNNSMLDRTTIVEHKYNSRMIAEERQNAINLAKWMDDKLANFKRKQKISFMDILEYKQTILNYALGTIIESLTKKCKEEGQILSLIWNNTFNMFEEVFKVLVQSNLTKQKQKIQQSKELNEIFEINHNFLREQNQALKKQNSLVIDKMKNVIIWNKRLRKDKKSLNTNNRILQYRNETYSQALQQTIQMILKSSPQSHLIIAAKNIVTKLSKEKGKKKHFIKKQVDTQFEHSTKTKVLKWISDNSYLNQQPLEQIKNICNPNSSGKEDLYEYNKLDEVNSLNKVDIYDFFKLYDYGCQVSPLITNTGVQCQGKVMKHVEVMTKKISNAQGITQTYYTGHHDYGPIAQEKGQNRQNENNSSSQKVHQQKKSKHGKSIKQKSNKKLSTKKQIPLPSTPQQQGRKPEFISPQKQNELNAAFQSKQIARKKKRLHNSMQATLKPQQQKLGNPIEQRRSCMNNREDNDYKIQDEILKSQSSDVSIQQRTKGIITSKHLLTANSIKFRDHHDTIDSMLNLDGLGARVSRVNNQRKKSLAYFRIDQSCKNVGILKKKKFNQTYKDERDQMNHTGKAQFMDQIIRRRSFYCKQKIQFSNFKQAEDITERSREYLRGSHYTKPSFFQIQKPTFLLQSVDKIIKRDPAISNMAKSKTLQTSKHLFSSINASIDKIVRIPPKNKQFVNNSLTILTKYISQLIIDYVKIIRKQKQDIQIDCQKAIYPLNILLIDRMTCKYGLKDIAQKKIKHFLQKILTFSNISQKIQLYSILLGLTDQQVGSDELLIYLKCLVYFDNKKIIKQSSISSCPADIQVIRENIHKVLEYFFDKEYISLIELKLQILYQQSGSEITVQAISLLIIKELMARKKELNLKYSKVHWMNSIGGNFFINVFKMLKMVNNYQDMIVNCDLFKKNETSKATKESFQILISMKNRQMSKNHQKTPSEVNHFFSLTKFDITKIAQILRDLMKRSDIMDQQHGKSITRQRFITAAVLHGLPKIQDIQTLISFFQANLGYLKSESPIYKDIVCNDIKSLQKLGKRWKYNGKIKSNGDKLCNLWEMALIYDSKLEEEVMDVMGKIGVLGLYVENSLINLILE